MLNNFIDNSTFPVVVASSKENRNDTTKPGYKISFDIIPVAGKNLSVFKASFWRLDLIACIKYI